jgi:hypothetical protein
LEDSLSSTGNEAFELQEREPSSEELKLYETWFDFDGEIHEERNLGRQRADHQLSIVLTKFGKQRDRKVSQKGMPDETMREYCKKWIRSESERVSKRDKSNTVRQPKPGTASDELEKELIWAS